MRTNSNSGTVSLQLKHLLLSILFLPAYHRLWRMDRKQSVCLLRVFRRGESFHRASGQLCTRQLQVRMTLSASLKGNVSFFWFSRLGWEAMTIIYMYIRFGDWQWINVKTAGQDGFYRQRRVSEYPFSRSLSWSTYHAKDARGLRNRKRRAHDYHRFTSDIN